VIYVITHGDRFVCADPGHTEKGFAQLRSLSKHLFLCLPASCIFVGTGKRFREIYGTLFGGPCRVIYSPFCGGTDALGSNPDGKKTVIISGLELNYPEEYLGVSNCPAFDAWKFITDMPDNSMVCSGRPLMFALGHRECKMGSLYEVDPTNRTVRCIKEGYPQ
jgi:hypothetical protein